MKKSVLRPYLRNFTYLFICVLLNISAYTQSVIRKIEKNQTHTYSELITAYGKLAKKHKNSILLEYGKTDIGKPVPVFVITENGNYLKELKNEKKVNILINNGIHPGEPDGIDASLWLAEEILEKNQVWLKKINLVIIAIYNVDGALNRSCCSRANQNGPEEYGFRGNAKNLDLNRDFIKADSRNARTFSAIFHLVKPHVFADTHVSNGADYQYTFTLITTQLDKLGGPVSEFIKKEMQPALFSKMEKRKFPVVPYVNTIGETPESGIIDFNEMPRFATGYTALFNTIGFTTETHMFKPYKDRVTATHHFLEELIIYCTEFTDKIIQVKKQADTKIALWKPGNKYYFNYENDTSVFEWIDFMGYEAEYPVNEITGKAQLYYNRSKPYTRKIKYFNRYAASDSTTIPYAFIIPQAWEDIISGLEMNKVIMHRFDKDTSLHCSVYYIRDYNTVSSPYEGHYLHDKTITEETKQQIEITKGDYLIIMNQPANRFLMEVLEPRAVDSYFNWNFFDAVLQQKEWFSSYVFADKAKEILENDPELKKEFEEKKKTDSKFLNNAFAQLLFIYRNSPYYELSHNRYPVYRIERAIKFPATVVSDKTK